MTKENVDFEPSAVKFWWETSGTLYVHGDPDIVFDARPPDDAIPLIVDVGEQLKAALTSNFRQLGKIARLRAALDIALEAMDVISNEASWMPPPPLWDYYDRIRAALEAPDA